MFYILSGYIRIYSLNARNDQYTHIIYGPGEIFPLTWLTQQERTSVFYEAMTDAEIRSVSLEQFNADLKEVPKLAYSMLQQSVEQYRLYAMRVVNLEYKYASERLAYGLILLANRFGLAEGKRVTIIPPMTHQLLGSTLNLSRESISREMEKLMRRGLVCYDKSRQIVIEDIQALSQQCHVPLYQGLPTFPAANTINYSG